MGEPKFHLSINVSNLQESVQFYERLFGPAAKHFPDYAKFEVESPPLVLSLEPAREKGLNHFGIRVKDAAILTELSQKVQAAGLSLQFLESVDCCHSRQTKFFLTDPDGQSIEFYVLESEELSAPKSKETIAKTSWEHLIGTDFDTIPYGDDTLEEVRLRGTFNIRIPDLEKERILDESLRALKPGGLLSLHLLVADREIDGKLPQLPGPAALVEYAPEAVSVLSLLRTAGLTALYCKRFSHAPVFQFQGAEMRELFVTGIKPYDTPIEIPQSKVLYRGPFVSVRDDDGNEYPQGKQIRVTQKQLATLKNTSLQDHFVFFTPAQAVKP